MISKYTYRNSLTKKIYIFKVKTTYLLYYICRTKNIREIYLRIRIPVTLLLFQNTFKRIHRYRLKNNKVITTRVLFSLDYL